MGRARGHSLQAAAVTAGLGRFDAVVGARRGSVNAQAARDAGEMQQVCEDSLTEMRAHVNVMLIERGITPVGLMFDRLVAAYRAGEHQPGTPEHDRLCQDLESALRCVRIADCGRNRGEMIEVAAYGDPPGWPGLTAPAVTALGNVMRVTNADEASSLREFSEVAVTALLGECDTVEHYQRLAPVFAGLATISQHLPNNKVGVMARARMIMVLRLAPTQSLSGPLQPLMQTFVQRIKSSDLTGTEGQKLKAIRSDQFARDGRIAEEFRPIADILY